MTKKEMIIISYYEEGLNTITISKNLNVSKQYVSKIIRTDSRYSDEKNKRKEESAIRQKQRNIQCIIKNRKTKKSINERLEGFMQSQHFQASGELSAKRTINNRAFKKWNSSIYDYHSRTNEFRLKKEFKEKTSYAVPKKIKWD